MNLSFSPYKSPVSQQQQPHGNLTGSLRKLKDAAADVHNLLAKWNSQNQEGASVINQIATIKLEIMYKSNTEDSEQVLSTILPLSLEPKCQALLLICKSMEALVAKLEVLASSVQGLQKLSQYQADSDSILFKTWTINVFVEIFDILHKMYAKELSLKQQLAQCVAHATSREMLMFYSAAWVHQPYTDSKHLLQSLLLETGHC